MYRDYATSTIRDVHVYVDSVAGNDNNDGLSTGNAKATIEAATKVLPDVANNNVVLHLKSTSANPFTLSKSIVFSTMIKGDGNPGTKLFIVDGGEEVEVVTDGGPWTATTSTSTSITDSGRSWSTNQLQGCILEIITGTYAGHTRTIASNTGDTIYPTIGWAGAPGNVDFRIVKPATTITGTGTWFHVNNKASHDVVLQRLRITGSVFVGSVGAMCNYIRLGGIVNESSNPFLFYGASSKVLIQPSIHDTSNLNMNSVIANKFISCSYIGSGASAITVMGSPQFNLYSGVFPKAVNITNCGDFYVYKGSFIGSLNSVFSKGSFSITTSYLTGIQSTIKGSSGAGLNLEDSTISILDPLSIDDSTTNGVQAKHSRVEIGTAALSGSGNGGAGLYAIEGSIVTIKDGYKPTITGSVGDVSTDGTTEATTWEGVAIGSPYSDIGEMVLVKEVA